MVFAALGTSLAVEGYRSLTPRDAELTHGQVIHAELTRRWFAPRWLLTIRINGTETRVKAILAGQGSSPDLPKEVSFYYSGDPAREITLSEDVQGLYLGLALIVIGAFCFLVCFWDRIRRFG